MAIIKLLVLSDTHDTAFPGPCTVPRVDVVLHCGDLTNIGGLAYFRAAAEKLASYDAELKLAIPGNHDVDLDAAWCAAELPYSDEGEPQKVKAIFGEFADKGVRLLDEGPHRFQLKDGREFSVYASPYTPACNGYAFAYGPDEDRFKSIEKHSLGGHYDIIMTHGPPAVPGGKLDIGHGGRHLGCPKLWNAIKRAQPTLHCFGHIHEAYGAQWITWGTDDSFNIEDARTAADDGQRRQTALVNAAIMRHGPYENNKPVRIRMSTSDPLYLPWDEDEYYIVPSDEDEYYIV